VSSHCGFHRRKVSQMGEVMIIPSVGFVMEGRPYLNDQVADPKFGQFPDIKGHHD